MFFKKPITKADNDRLSQLIQLKRRERPDAAFWDKFDEQLRSKQLAALVRTQPWYERLGKLSILLARKSAAVTATACIFALGVFTISKSEYFAGNQPTADDSQIETSLTANDASIAVQPMFVVEDSRLLADGNEQEFAYGINAIPSYEVNTLTKKQIPVSYQIIAEPKQFTAGQIDAGNGLGAKIIRTGNHF